MTKHKCEHCAINRAGVHESHCYPLQVLAQRGEPMTYREWSECRGTLQFSEATAMAYENYLATARGTEGSEDAK